jgi:hypothetical protein
MESRASLADDRWPQNHRAVVPSYTGEAVRQDEDTVDHWLAGCRPYTERRTTLIQTPPFGDTRRDELSLVQLQHRRGRRERLGTARIHPSKLTNS